MKTIVPITKDEAAYLRPLLHPWKGIDRYISRVTANGKYYMTESREAMRLLREYRAGNHKSK